MHVTNNRDWRGHTANILLVRKNLFHLCTDDFYSDLLDDLALSGTLNVDIGVKAEPITR